MTEEQQPNAEQVMDAAVEQHKQQLMFEMEQRRNAVRLLFFAQALKKCADQSVFKFAKRVKYGLNIFLAAYKKDVLPELYNMYKDGQLEDEYEKAAMMIEELANECANVRSEDFPVAIGLLRALNEGKLNLKENEQ
jgi:hypothetical protein